MAYYGTKTIHAWVNFNSSGTPSIRASYNCSSIGDYGTCHMQLNMSTAVGNSNYGWYGSIGHHSDNQQGWISSPSGTSMSTWKTSSSLRCRSVYGNQASNIEPHDQTMVILYNT